MLVFCAFRTLVIYGAFVSWSKKWDCWYHFQPDVLYFWNGAVVVVYEENIYK